jgi:hypothetical protein
MKTCAEVAAWCAGAAAEFGDASAVCGQVFARWHPDLSVAVEGDELVATLHQGRVVVALAEDVQLPLVVEEKMAIAADGSLDKFGAEKICPGVYALEPSLNVQGIIHVFVILYDVPDPPPWERRIIVPGGGRIEVPA